MHSKKRLTISIIGRIFWLIMYCLFLSGCTIWKTGGGPIASPNIEDNGCNRPPGLVESQDQEIEIFFGYGVVSAGLSYKNFTGIHDVIGQNNWTDLVHLYIVCVARNRGYSKDEQKYLHNQLQFFSTKPTADEWLEWEEANRPPPGELKISPEKVVFNTDEDRKELNVLNVGERKITVWLLKEMEGPFFISATHFSIPPCSQNEADINHCMASLTIVMTANAKKGLKNAYELWFSSNSPRSAKTKIEIIINKTNPRSSPLTEINTFNFTKS